MNWAMEGWKASGTTLALISVLVLGGCGSDEKPSDETQTEQTEQTESDQPSESTEPTEDTGTDGPPDLCALFSAADFETVTGEQAAGEPDTQSSVGVIQSSCTYSTAGGFPMVMIGAYDASGFELTVQTLEGQPVDSLDGDAYWTQGAGIVVGLEGQDWYLQVVATDAGMDYDKDMSTAGAQIVLDNLG